MTHPRSSRAYRALCARVRREEHTCWLCGRDIDPNAPAKTSPSWSLDHVVPLNKGGPLLDRANARAAHYGCNSARGDRPPTRTKPRTELVTSRDW